MVARRGYETGHSRPYLYDEDERGEKTLTHEKAARSLIASELFISVATVRKHLEHIYDRTGVRTRAKAAALMRNP